ARTGSIQITGALVSRQLEDGAEDRILTPFAMLFSLAHETDVCSSLSVRNCAANSIGQESRNEAAACFGRAGIPWPTFYHAGRDAGAPRVTHFSGAESLRIARPG